MCSEQAQGRGHLGSTARGREHRRQALGWDRAPPCGADAALLRSSCQDKLWLNGGHPGGVTGLLVGKPPSWGQKGGPCDGRLRVQGRRRRVLPTLGEKPPSDLIPPTHEMGLRLSGEPPALACPDCSEVIWCRHRLERNPQDVNPNLGVDSQDPVLKSADPKPPTGGGCC